MRKILSIVSLASAILVLTVSCSKTSSYNIAFHVKEVTLDKEEAWVLTGKTITLKATILPDNASEKTLVWESADNSIATVTQGGEVTGVAAGSTYVKATSVDGGKTASCKISVADKMIPVSSVSLDKTELTLKDTETYTLKATVLPEEASDKSVKWSSSDAYVANVSASGLVTPSGPGTADITVTTTDGGHKAVCKLTVASTHTRKRPSGTNWTKVAVADGFDMYTFAGKDPVSNSNQYVVVADLDTSKYKLNFLYNGTRYITSKVLSNTKSVLAMNGAYETTSIYIKVDGSPKKYLENDCISNTDVPNWKNDGAVCVDSKGRISFLNTIMRTEDEEGSGSYGKTLKNQREYYKSYAKMTPYYAAFSSAPLMIYNYKALGLTFVPDKYSSKSYWSKLNSEDPYRHQANTHPRTVVAMDCNGRLLLLVADGRWTQAVGYSCRDLTQFLINNFDPKFALNMDGGGSTDMCVAGQGRADTHVVNHPCDSGTWDNPGEREVTSFFYVTKK